MLQDVVLHDVIVTMGVYPEVGVFGLAPLDNAAEYSVDLRETAYPVNDMIGKGVFQPLTAEDLGVGRFR